MFVTEHEMAERLKKDKVQYKNRLNKNQNKINVDFGRRNGFENADDGVESLETHYETVGHLSRLAATTLELERMEEDFSQIERLVTRISKRRFHSG